jgi:surfactin synthase thioesterase subunit
MKVIGVFFVWCLLLVVCWPLALLALVLAPLVWLVALPFRLAGVCLGAVFAFIKALLFLPARLLGAKV